MKSYAEYLGVLAAGDGAQLSEHDSVQLAGALLDGGVPEIELGALIATLRMREIAPVFLDGLFQAIGFRAHRWRYENKRIAPLAIGCYGGSWDVPNLAPLIGLMLARIGVPVILHGPLHAHAGISCALVLRALGVMPCAHYQQVADELESRRIAFVPDALLAPGVASLLALRARLGPAPILHLAARVIAPFEPDTLLMVWADNSEELKLMRDLVASHGLRALLLHVAKDEGGTRILRRPHIEYWLNGACEVLFDEDRLMSCPSTPLPDPSSADSIAGWIQQACNGVQAIPAAQLSQLAACLYASGYCDDFSQAKALAAVSVNMRLVA